MMNYDIAVIGSGPAGQKAAIQAAKAGRNVVVIEFNRLVGGACVHRATIPSKTLGATAHQLRMIRSCNEFLKVDMAPNIKIAMMMGRLHEVTTSHAEYMHAQLQRNGIDLVTGHAKFVDKNRLKIERVRGADLDIRADIVIIATGSRPRKPPEIPVDHEYILDSDSILSIVYLPKSLTVLGGGVIASEYASIFASLGTKVTMIDKGTYPVSFMDPELCQRFVTDFERNGGRYVPGSKVKECRVDEMASTATELSDGEIIRSDRVLCALGRLANVEELGLNAIGVELAPRGHITVDKNCRTTVDSIYAVGDVIGPPSLASTSMEQGRRAMCHALGLHPGAEAIHTPIGIYTVPGISSVGLTEEQALEQFGECTIGRADYSEVARGQISRCSGGLLKIVADKNGEKLLGTHIIGDDACNLIHLAQLALISGMNVDTFVENIFNFPTMTEAYRIAALDLINRKKKQVHRPRNKNRETVTTAAL